MSTLRMFAMTAAMAVCSNASSFAAVMSGGHGAAAYAGGHSSFRDDSRSHVNDGVSGRRFRQADAGPQHWRRHEDRRKAWAYAYGGYPYDLADYGYGDTYGPQPPYGDSFAGPYGPVGRPMAPTLAPSAYGPGAHDGAYAYGYNGYAQTPALPQVGPSGYWRAGPGARACGC